METSSKNAVVPIVAGSSNSNTTDLKSANANSKDARNYPVKLSRSNSRGSTEASRKYGLHAGIRFQGNPRRETVVKPFNFCSRPKVTAENSTLQLSKTVEKKDTEDIKIDKTGNRQRISRDIKKDNRIVPQASEVVSDVKCIGGMPSKCKVVATTSNSSQSRKLELSEREKLFRSNLNNAASFAKTLEKDYNKDMKIGKSVKLQKKSSMREIQSDNRVVVPPVSVASLDVKDEHHERSVSVNVVFSSNVPAQCRISVSTGGVATSSTSNLMESIEKTEVLPAKL